MNERKRDRHPIIATVRGTTEQHQRIKAAAEAAGKSVNRFLLDAAAAYEGNTFLDRVRENQRG